MEYGEPGEIATFAPLMNPESFYLKRLEDLKAKLKKLQKKKSAFGIIRFGTIATIIVAFYFLSSLGMIYALSTALLPVVIFIRLVHIDLANKSAITHTNHLMSINEAEIRSINGNYSSFENGSIFMPKDHLYATDIDILGAASLYQLSNRTTSGIGAGRLAEWFLNPAGAEDILSRQEAVKELSKKHLLGQELRAHGIETRITMATRERLLKWLNDPMVFSQFKPWRWLRVVLPTISVFSLVAGIEGWIPEASMYLSLLIFAIIAYQINKIVAPLHEKLSKIAGEIDALSASVALIENETFHSPMLISLQQQYKGGGSISSQCIYRLKKILDKLDLRYNIVVSAPLNLFLLWNLQQVLDLEKWKSESGKRIQSWFEALGTIEALNSFATLHFNNPDWCFPEIKADYFFIKAEELGHPLINKKKRVNNYISLEHSSQLMVVTGSNMAGKSTYLRSVGINIVLAMAGSPVCATEFIFSPVQLVSSMRISDNLEESTSTFYAELKKLKTIIEKVNNGEQIFILLDEILRGTNTLDRHRGSVALIRQFIRKASAGIIATHDLGLGEIRNEFPANILNFHFDAEINNEELFFDYKLKPGVSKSMNASLLMKKIGIEL